jgi:hypothetical protein
MTCSRHSKKSRLKTNQTSKTKDPFGFPDSSNSIKMGPVQNNQIIKVYLLRGSTMFRHVVLPALAPAAFSLSALTLAIPPAVMLLLA